MAAPSLKRGSELKHVCGLQGFGWSIHDVCPKCEYERLTDLGVPEDFAAGTAWLRYLSDPGGSPAIEDMIAEKLEALNKQYKEKYGRDIP
jgi:hypothetical protein